MMPSRAAGAGTPGSRPRTRRSARSAAPTAAAAIPAPLLEPAGPPAAGSAGPSTGSPDDTDGGPSATKRPRTAAVGLFSGDSLDQDAAPDTGSTTPAAGGTAALSTAEQTSADSSASGGGQRNVSCAQSPPAASGAGSAAQTATVTGSDQTAAEEEEEEKPDCGICLETCLHPVKLPCGHIFCYLCVKGAAKQSARCAYCRAEVTEKYINNPRLLDESEVEREMTDTSSHHWLYQGRNGWWRYDERTSRDIEEAYSAQEPSVQISVAGELYTVEFASLTQFNDECRGRRRRVRREAADATPDPTLRCKGVAGLRKKRRRGRQ